MRGSKRYRAHPQAWLEVEAADDWYLARSLDASITFLTDVYDALDIVTDARQRWPKYLYGTRRYVLRRFPFSIIYLDDPDVVNVVAVAHNKRKPGYWKERL